MHDDFQDFEENSTSKKIPAGVMVARIADNPPPRPIAKIAEALSKAQAEMVQPEKNKTVEVKNQAGTSVLYTFDYADYNAIVEAVRGPLSKFGIAFTHLVDIVDRELVLVTRLIHSSGEFLESLYPLPSSRNPKDLGGAITYGKRYCLSAITGCVADDDLDSEPANVSSFKDRTKAPQNPPQGRGQASGPLVKGNPGGTGQTPNGEPPKQNQGGPVTEPQIKRLFAISNASKWTNEQVKLFMDLKWKIDSTKNLTREQYDILVDTIQQKTYVQACVAAGGDQTCHRARVDPWLEW